MEWYQKVTNYFVQNMPKDKNCFVVVPQGLTGSQNVQVWQKVRNTDGIVFENTMNHWCEQFNDDLWPRTVLTVLQQQHKQELN